MTEASNAMAFLNFQSWREILIILAVVLILFGGKKLPELARGLAKGMRIFRDELKGVKDELEKTDVEPTDAPRAQLPPRDAAGGGSDATQQQQQEQPK